MKAAEINATILLTPSVLPQTKSHFFQSIGGKMLRCSRSPGLIRKSGSLVHFPSALSEL